MLLHDMAVCAGKRIIAEVGSSFGVMKSVCACAKCTSNHDPHEKQCERSNWKPRRGTRLSIVSATFVRGMVFRGIRFRIAWLSNAWIGRAFFYRMIGRIVSGWDILTCVLLFVVLFFFVRHSKTHSASFGANWIASKTESFSLG